MNDKPKWKKGAPPSIGWWPASVLGNNIEEIRWWDGKLWSHAAYQHQSPQDAAIRANVKNFAYSADVLWTERWWL